MKRVTRILGLVIALTCVCLPVSASPLGGLQYGSGVAVRGYWDDFHFVFIGNETTTVTVVGDGDGDIDCFVFDENWIQVTYDTSWRAGCEIYINPRWTGPFVVRIVNASREGGSRYTLVAR